MVTKTEVKRRAVMMAITTGEMPEVYLIWAKQKAEDCVECFGQGLACGETACYWRRQCRALDFFAELTWEEAARGVNQTEVPAVLQSSVEELSATVSGPRRVGLSRKEALAMLDP